MPHARRVLPAVLLVLLALLGATGSEAGAATLAGSPAVQAGADSNTAGRAEAFSAVAGASGPVTSLSVYVDASATATRALVGLYASAGSHAGALLTQGTIPAPKGGAWNTVTVPAASVTAGTTYWIALLGPAGAGTLAFRDKGSGGSPCETSSQASLAALPATWSAGTSYRDGPASAYASSSSSTTPVLSVGPASLSFAATQGGSAPPAQSVAVAEASGGVLPFTTTTDAAWLSATPASGTAPATVRVAADAGALAPGTYQGRVTVTAPGATGSPAAVAVTLTVSAAPPPPPPPPPPSGPTGCRSSTTRRAAAFAPSETSLTPTTAREPRDGLDARRRREGHGRAAVRERRDRRRAQSHDVVVVATASNAVYALDATSGAVLWRRGLSGSVTGNCAIPGGYGIGALAGRSTRPRARSTSSATAASCAPWPRRRHRRRRRAGRRSPARHEQGLGRPHPQRHVDLYVATASDGCDTPPWRGRVVRVDVSGAAPRVAATWTSSPGIPAPNGGGGIWGYGGVAADPATGRVYATPGGGLNEAYAPTPTGIVALDAGPERARLLRADPSARAFPCNGAPCDVDFGATPVGLHPVAAARRWSPRATRTGTSTSSSAATLAAGGAPRQTLR